MNFSFQWKSFHHVEPCDCLKVLFFHILMRQFLYLNSNVIFLQNLLVFRVDYIQFFFILLFVTCLVGIILLMFNVFCDIVMIIFNIFSTFVIIIIFSTYFPQFYNLFQWKIGCSFLLPLVSLEEFFATQVFS